MMREHSAVTVILALGTGVAIGRVSYQGTPAIIMAVFLGAILLRRFWRETA